MGSTIKRLDIWGSLQLLIPKIWNELPNNLKELTKYEMFKKELKQWNDPKCKCNLCR